jgi:septum formation protein
MLYRNNTKNPFLARRLLRNFDAERVTIAGRQGTSEHQNSGAKPTRPKTDSSCCFGIPLILGSQSPRRREILGFFSLPFVQIPSDFDEESFPFQEDPARYATTLSRKKAEELTKRFPGHLILTADTVVFFEGTIYNKPKNEEEAFLMLRNLSGKRHQVFTAVTMQRDSEVHSGCEETKIFFNPLTDSQIRLFHRSCPSLDKAGAYTIQSSGSILVSRIEGCYYNVMGLPINTVHKLLGNFGIDLWQHLNPC